MKLLLPIHAQYLLNTSFSENAWPIDCHKSFLQHLTHSWSQSRNGSEWIPFHPDWHNDAFVIKSMFQYRSRHVISSVWLMYRWAYKLLVCLFLDDVSTKNSKICRNKVNEVPFTWELFLSIITVAHVSK